MLAPIDFLGVDPGKGGGWALLAPDGIFINAGHCPETPQETAMAIIGLRNAAQERNRQLFGCLELVRAWPGQGVVSMFSFGDNYGTWKGILAALQIPYIFVAPRKWQKRILDSQVDGHHAFARRRWPTAPLARKKDEALAAALCLAEYGRLIYVQT